MAPATVVHSVVGTQRLVEGNNPRISLVQAPTESSRVTLYSKPKPTPNIPPSVRAVDDLGPCRAIRSVPVV
jgi:hypothetical protein